MQGRVSAIVTAEVITALVLVLYHGTDDMKLDAAALVLKHCTGDNRKLFYGGLLWCDCLSVSSGMMVVMVYGA
jgi:hypothetical protein